MKKTTIIGSSFLVAAFAAYAYIHNEDAKENLTHSVNTRFKDTYVYEHQAPQNPNYMCSVATKEINGLGGRETFGLGCYPKANDTQSTVDNSVTLDIVKIRGEKSKIYEITPNSNSGWLCRIIESYNNIAGGGCYPKAHSTQSNIDHPEIIDIVNVKGNESKIYEFTTSSNPNWPCRIIESYRDISDGGGCYPKQQHIPKQNP